MLLGAVAVGAVAVAGFLVFQTGTGDPLELVESWIDARGSGDIDGALDLVSSDGNILGFSMADEAERQRLTEALQAQAAAGWTADLSDCVVTDDEVKCNYEMGDEILRRWDAVLTGTHTYRVQNGKIVFADRMHDRASRNRTYRAIRDFRAWVHERHPELEEVIWSEAGSVGYSTVAGAEAMLGLIDEYEPFREASP